MDGLLVDDDAAMARLQARARADRPTQDRAHTLEAAQRADVRAAGLAGR